jgi:flagellar basal body-associated protein FliL
VLTRARAARGHRPQPSTHRSRGEEESLMSIVTILIIVLVVLLVLGIVGRGRLG